MGGIHQPFRTGLHHPPALFIGNHDGYLIPIIAFRKTVLRVPQQKMSVKPFLFYSGKFEKMAVMAVMWLTLLLFS